VQLRSERQDRGEIVFDPVIDLVIYIIVVVLWLLLGHKVPTGAPTSTYDRPRWKRRVWSCVALVGIVLLVRVLIEK
jgi:hypothetical protein